MQEGLLGLLLERLPDPCWKRLLNYSLYRFVRRRVLGLGGLVNAVAKTNLFHSSCRTYSGADRCLTLARAAI